MISCKYPSYKYRRVRSVFTLTMPPLSLNFVFPSPPKTLSFSRIPLNVSPKNDNL